jgi:hypothetical protein
MIRKMQGVRKGISEQGRKLKVEMEEMRNLGSKRKDERRNYRADNN